MRTLERLRTFPLALLACVLVGRAGAAETAARLDEVAAKSAELVWVEAKKLSMVGQGWQDTKADYDRLPARAEELVRKAVWDLSRHTAGVAVLFETDATAIHSRWSLTSDRLAMPHMAATGVSGLDLYVRDEANHWRWLACGQPSNPSNEQKLVSGVPPAERSYMLYLPLYNGIKSLEIGVPRGNKIVASQVLQRHQRKPIVFYGTSITQGACASRPGMAHTAILGRQFDREVINLGFSGNGRMEPEVVKLIAELNAAAFVLDCLPNMDPAGVLARTEPCIQILRESNPKTPILLIEDRTFADAYLVGSKAESNSTNRIALQRVFEKLINQGDQNLYYLAGDRLLGDDNEATVDSSHPTDLGFVRQAEAIDKVLARILPSKAD